MPLNLAGLAIRATSIAGTPCSGRSVSNASPTEGTSARSISQRRVVVAKITCFVSSLLLFALRTTPCAQEGTACHMPGANVPSRNALIRKCAARRFCALAYR